MSVATYEEPKQEITKQATRKATERLIDSVWTIEFLINEEGKAVIVKLCRDDKEGYEKEKEFMRGAVIEDHERTAVKLCLRPYENFGGWCNESNCTESYEIANPKHIFEY